MAPPHRDICSVSLEQKRTVEQMQSRVPRGAEGHRSDNPYPQSKLHVSLDDVRIESRHRDVEYQSCARKCLVDAFSSSETFVVGNDRDSAMASNVSGCIDSSGCPGGTMTA